MYNEYNETHELDQINQFTFKALTSNTFIMMHGKKLYHLSRHQELS